MKRSKYHYVVTYSIWFKYYDNYADEECEDGFHQTREFETKKEALEYANGLSDEHKNICIYELIAERNHYEYK